MDKSNDQEWNELNDRYFLALRGYVKKLVMNRISNIHETWMEDHPKIFIKNYNTDERLFIANDLKMIAENIEKLLENYRRNT